MNGRKPLTAAQVERLTASTQPWLSCDDCFEAIDGYVDALVGGGGIAEPLRVHLTNCPACFEEAETLASLVAHEHGMNEQAVVAALRAEVHPARGTPARPRGRRARLFRGRGASAG